MKVSRWIDTRWDQVKCPHRDVGEGSSALSRTKSLYTYGPGPALPSEVPHAPLHPLIASVFDEARDRWGGPLLVTSGVRCRWYQDVLRRQGYRTAWVSPQLFGVALDVKPKKVLGGSEDVKKLAVLLHDIDGDLRIFTARYGFRFIHLDCAYLVSDEDRTCYAGLQTKPEAYRPGARDFP